MEVHSLGWLPYRQKSAPAAPPLKKKRKKEKKKENKKRKRKNKICGKFGG